MAKIPSKSFPFQCVLPQFTWLGPSWFLFSHTYVNTTLWRHDVRVLWLQWHNRQIPQILQIPHCSSSISHNALRHFLTEICTRVHFPATKWCIVGYLIQCGVCEMGLVFPKYKRHPIIMCPLGRDVCVQNFMMTSWHGNAFHITGPRIDDACWRHQMETFSALLAICEGNSPVSGEFPAQRPVTLSFHVFFYLRLNKRVSKQWWGWWFETLSRPLWRHCNGDTIPQSASNAVLWWFRWCSPE